MEEIIRFYNLGKLKIIFCYREQDEHLRMAESEGISFEKANKQEAKRLQYPSKIF